MDRGERIRTASGLMAAYAGRGRRYLWTDAFAVRNLFALERATGEARYRAEALELIGRVHGALGRQRPDSGREGWLREASEAHPTRGGLRIGKELPERAPSEPFDAELEWDRDGQYFHYLTQWMHALGLAGRITEDARYTLWARELAQAAYRGFVTEGPGGALRMFWKMSIDLDRPLVPSMGQHDPLDGYVTYRELGGLDDEVRGLSRMLEEAELETADPLGIGGLLSDTARAAALGERALVSRLFAAAHRGLAAYARCGDLGAPAGQRLPFRELGLAIGLETAQRLPAAARLAHFAPLAAQVVSFWLEPAHQRTRTFVEHRDINEVMLATALLGK